MAYDPNSPATTHAGLSDCDKIRTNCNELRKFEASATEPSNPVAGMIWLYTPGSGDWILKERNKTNDAWIEMITVTAAGSPKAHIETNITESVSAHGIKQGSGNNFNADKLDGKHAADFPNIYDNVDSIYNFTSGSSVMVSAPTQQPITSTTYEKKKEITLNRTNGTLRIYFEITGPSGGGTTYGRIYRNGSPVGTERSRSVASWEGFTENISGWSNGDLLQLYVKVSTGTGYTRNFRVLATKNMEVALD